IIIDREKEMPVIIASARGGMEIEEVAQDEPQSIFKEHVHPVTGLADCHIRNLAFKLGLSKVQQKNFSQLLSSLYELFIKTDMSLVEINPLIVTGDDLVMALDAKINFDDNALFRHPELAAWREEEARQRDWPRGHVLSDNLLVTMAQRKPRDIATLKAIPDLPQAMPATVMSDLLAAISRGLAVKEGDYPRPADEGVSKHNIKTRYERVSAHISSVCATHHIDPALVGSRAEIESFLHLMDQSTADGHPLSTSWRSTLITEALR
ncbi:MAG: ATP-grasp domain-containing protein, partial [bacterium]